MISDESWYGPFLFLVRHYLFSYNEWNKWIQIDDASNDVCMKREEISKA